MIKNAKPTEFIKLLFQKIIQREKELLHSTDIDNTRYIDCETGIECSTALQLSVEMGQLGNFKEILTHQPNFFLQDSSLNTSLHSASKQRKTEFTEMILRHVGEADLFKLLERINDKEETPLIVAVKNGNIDVTSKLLESGSKINPSDKHGYCILHHAVCLPNETEQFEMIEFILNHQKQLKNEAIKSLTEFQDINGSTPLHNAITSQCFSAVKQLVCFSSTLRISDKKEQTPLHLAVLSKHNDIFDIILDSILKQEAECSDQTWLEHRSTCVKQKDGKTPLHLSIETKNTHALTALLKTNPCLDICDMNGDTLLHCAVNNPSDDVTCLEILLKELKNRFSDDYSYFVCLLNSRKLTPLLYSIKLANFNCIQKLLDYEINLAYRKPCGDLTLSDGIDGFSLSFVKYENKYWTGYEFTKHGKNCCVFTILPDLDDTKVIKSNFQILTRPDLKLLELISQTKSTEPLDAALRINLLKLDMTFEDQQTDIHMSQVIARHGTKQSLKCLLGNNKSDLFLRSDGKQSMIECAVSNPNNEALIFLLDNLPKFHEEPDIKESEDRSDDAAICSCLKKSFQLSLSNPSSIALVSLLHFFPKIDNLYEDDNTLIHLMVIKCQSSEFLNEALQVICEIQSSKFSNDSVKIINYENFCKKTALHCCIEKKQLNLLEVLLKFKPDPFVEDHNLETSLHYAVNSNVLEFVEKIYQYTADAKILSAKNRKDENTALHLAVNNANNPIVEYLLSCKAPFHLQNKLKSTVLHLAMCIEDPSKRNTIIDTLLGYKPDQVITCIQDSNGYSPLHLAVSNQHSYAVDSLLQADPEALHVTDNNRQTPLHLAVIPSCYLPNINNPSVGGEVPEVINLDEKVFDSVLNAIRQKGEHEEKQYCDVKHLICIQDVCDRTALHYAIEHHQLNAFKKLLKTGSCLDIPDVEGHILAHEAVKEPRSIEFLRLLLTELKARYPNINDCFKIENYESK